MAKVLQRLVRRGLLASHAGHARRLSAGAAAGADLGGRRHPGDRRAGHGHRLLDRRRHDCEQFAKCNVRDPLWQSARADSGGARRVHDRGAGGGCPPPRGRARGGAAHALCAGRVPQARLARERNDGDQASDLHGLSRHDAGRSARRRGDAAVLHRALRQRRQPQPSVRLGGRGGGREGAQAGRRSDRREREGDRLHQRRDRVEQPGDQGRRRDVPREGQSHHHVRHRAQGGHRHVQAAREGRLPRHLSAGAEGRPHQPRRAARRDHRQDDPHLDHDRQQRDRRHPADRRDRRDREGEGRSCSTPTRCRRSARCRSTSTS